MALTGNYLAITMRADRGDVIITSSQALIAPGLSPSPVGEGRGPNIYHLSSVGHLLVVGSTW